MKEQNLEFTIIVKENNSFTKKNIVTLKNLPTKGGFYTELPTKKTYEILDIIYEDLNTILIVRNSDKYENVIKLVYDK